MVPTIHGSLLFIESIGSRHPTEDHNIYDSDSGRWFDSLFELEEAFWASKFYDVGGNNLPAPKTPPRVEYKPLEISFQKYDVPLIGIDTDYQMRYNKKTLDDLYTFNNT